MTNFIIRNASFDDIEQVQAIYSQSVLEGTGSWEYDPPSLTEMQNRFETITAANYPFIVAIDGDIVLGYAYANTYKTRIGWRFCVEDSIYIAPQYQGKGIGKALLIKLIDECANRGFMQMIAVIGDAENLGSVALHKACGFTHMTTLKNVGYKFGKWLDSVIMQYSIAKENK
jgi:phosphinothricin acetyltransferase